ncbi:hypothetical protein R1flu_008431 [Riccia fluitans]|uniref:Uncharacterized protein n=1 Tax=Riccia fluitans TaxID=41844 RepID=A0ABD1YBM7_9MARC
MLVVARTHDQRRTYNQQRVFAGLNVTQSRAHERTRLALDHCFVNLLISVLFLISDFACSDFDSCFKKSSSVRRSSLSNGSLALSLRETCIDPRPQIGNVVLSLGKKIVFFSV